MNAMKNYYSWYLKCDAFILADVKNLEIIA